MKGKIPKGSDNRRARAKSMLSGGGYARGGATDEPDDCPNPSNPKCKKSGGPVSGDAAKNRLDKPRRYASGGGIDEMGSSKPKKGGAKTQVNIIIAGKSDKPDASMPPIPMPSNGPPPAPPAPPPGMRPPMGAPVPGAAPPSAFKRGGVVKKSGKYPITSGAGGGLGRLEKAAASKPSNDGSGKSGKK